MSRNRRRPIHLHVMVSEEELAQLQERMAEAGENMNIRPSCDHWAPAEPEKYS